MNILFVSAEMSPLAKVGGLGDVAGSLPLALRARGLDVRVAMPFYATIDRAKAAARRIGEVNVPLPGGDQRAAIWVADVRGVPVYLVEHEGMFGREKVYGFDDDPARFLLFCDALKAATGLLDFAPHAIHAQDWHAALLLTRLAAEPSHPWAGAGSVYTIHNLALQGNFDHGFAAHHGIGHAQLAPPDALPPEIMMSAMAQGIAHADRVNTVSDTYAREILTPEYGAGLDPLLRARQGVVSGIVNGIDYEEFDPQTDRDLAAHYGVDTLDARAENKRALQRQAGLPEDAGALLFGVVTRLFAQKGIDLLPAALEPVLAHGHAQLVVLGTGDEAVHEMLKALEARHPRQVKVWLDFNPPLGQKIYGGADCFLMPSRYEPCGLGQLISLRYGCVPLVRRTGGLADTVEDVDAGVTSGTGFVFAAADAHELQHACERALAAFAQPDAWRAIQQRGMRQDWSWGRAGARYAELYEAARASRAEKKGA